MTILVAGAQGMTGFCLMRELLLRGYTVVGVRRSGGQIRTPPSYRGRGRV